MDRFTAMRVFVDSVKLGSLAAAADRHSMSRSMVSRFVASLEEAYGVRLLQRNNRSLALTDAGKDILPYCEQMLELDAEIGGVANARHKEPAGLIRVGCATLLGHYYLVGAMMRYMELHPKVSVDLHRINYGDIRFIDDEIDIALLALHEVPKGMQAIKLVGGRRWRMYASPRFLLKHGYPECPKDLEKFNCLINTFHGNLWRLVQSGDDLFDIEEVQVSGNFQSNDHRILMEAAIAGSGIILMPPAIARTHMAKGEIAPVLSGYQTEALSLYAVFPSEKHISATLQSMLKFLTEDIQRELNKV